MRLQRFHRHVRPLFQHHERPRLGQPLLVLAAHHGGFQHGRVGGQRAFHLERAHPDAADLEHVVRPAAVAVMAAGFADVFVAGPGPFALERPSRLVALVPIAVAGAGPAHHQLPHLAIRQVRPRRVDDAQLVARHRAAGRAVADIAGLVGQEDVQHLGGADAVQDVHPHQAGPFGADMLRQRFPGGDAAAQPGRPGAGAQVGVRHQIGIQRRHAAQHGRAMLPHQRQHGVRRGAVREQHAARADRHREGHGVAEPIGEEQLGHGIHEVVRPNAQHLLAVRVKGRAQAAMDVAYAFGRRGGAGGVQPERRFVLAGRDRAVFAVGQKGVERDAAVRRPIHGHDRAQRWQARQHRRQGRHQRGGHHQQLRPAIRQHVGHQFGRQQRVDGDGHHAGPDGAPERDRELGRVVQQQGDAGLPPDAGPPQRGGEPGAFRLQAAIAQRAAVVDESGGVAAAFPDMPVHEPIGGVVGHPAAFPCGLELTVAVGELTRLCIIMQEPSGPAASLVRQAPRRVRTPQ